MKTLKNLIIIILIVVLMVFIIFKIYSIIVAGNELKKVTSGNENSAEDLIEKWEEMYKKTPEFIEGLSGKNTDNSFGLVIESDKADMDNYWYYIKGFVVNNSQNDYEEVLIQYDALDIDGYKLVVCSDIAYNLKAGEKYAFKATCVTDISKIHSYKLYNLVPLEPR